MTDTGRSPGAFVDRASELTELGTLLSAAEAGNGFLLLIRGDAGIGGYSPKPGDSVRWDL